MLRNIFNNFSMNITFLATKDLQLLLFFVEKIIFLVYKAKKQK